MCLGGPRFRGVDLSHVYHAPHLSSVPRAHAADRLPRPLVARAQVRKVTKLGHRGARLPAGGGHVLEGGLRVGEGEPLLGQLEIHGRRDQPRGLPAREAVREGVRSTAGVVTSAALVMVAVFAIFGTLRLIEFKQMGVGLAAAILIDATVIRGALLPATLALLGERPWYLPRWLGRTLSASRVVEDLQQQRIGEVVALDHSLDVALLADQHRRAVDPVHLA